MEREKSRLSCVLLFVKKKRNKIKETYIYIFDYAQNLWRNTPKTDDAGYFYKGN